MAASPWKQWGAWSWCSVVCGEGGIRERTRTRQDGSTGISVIADRCKKWPCKEWDDASHMSQRCNIEYTCTKCAESSWCSSHAPSCLECTGFAQSCSQHDKKCVCRTGYHFVGNECEIENQCLTGTHNCSPNGNCINGMGSFKCTCKAGYVGDGVTCTDRCAACSANSHCSNGVCRCKAGYVGDGLVCKSLITTTPTVTTTTVKPSWSEWSAYSSCKLSKVTVAAGCGDGQRERQRVCTNNNGKGCPKFDEAINKFTYLVNDSQWQDCRIPCGEWSHWGQWSGCSETCGSGTRSRRRSCDGGVAGDVDCPGDTTEKQTCEKGACPVVTTPIAKDCRDVTSRVTRTNSWTCRDCFNLRININLNKVRATFPWDRSLFLSFTSEIGVVKFAGPAVSIEQDGNDFNGNFRYKVSFIDGHEFGDNRIDLNAEFREMGNTPSLEWAWICEKDDECKTSGNPFTILSGKFKGEWKCDKKRNGRTTICKASCNGRNPFNGNAKARCDTYTNKETTAGVWRMNRNRQPSCRKADKEKVPASKTWYTIGDF